MKLIKTLSAIFIGCVFYALFVLIVVNLKEDVTPIVPIVLIIGLCFISPSILIIYINKRFDKELYKQKEDIRKVAEKQGAEVLHNQLTKDAQFNKFFKSNRTIHDDYGEEIGYQSQDTIIRDYINKLN